MKKFRTRTAAFLMAVIMLFGTLPLMISAEQTEIDTVEIILSQPIDGMTVGDYKGTLSIPDGASYELLGVYIYLSSGGTYLSDDYIFEAGESYQISSLLKAKDGFAFASSVTINAPDFIKNWQKRWQNGGEALLSCTAMEKPKYNVTFDGGNAAGSMDQLTVESGTEITLPEPTDFTAPEGKCFRWWYVSQDGTSGTDLCFIGDKITVTGNTYILAQWGARTLYIPTSVASDSNGKGSVKIDGVASSEPFKPYTLDSAHSVEAVPVNSCSFAYWDVEIYYGNGENPIDTYTSSANPFTVPANNYPYFGYEVHLTAHFAGNLIPIEEVIYDFPEPEVGDSPYDMVRVRSVPQEALYFWGTLEWFESASGTFEDLKPMTTETFQYGVYYTAFLTDSVEDNLPQWRGYEFNPDTVKYRVNGQLIDFENGNYPMFGPLGADKSNLKVVDFKPDAAEVNKPYTVSGRILDENDVPVEGLFIQVINQVGRGYYCYTDADGNFSVVIDQEIPSEAGKVINIKVIFNRPSSGIGTEYNSMSYEYDIRFDEICAVNFKIENGKWDDGSTEKAVSLISGSTITADDIPEMVPDSGYGVGEWDISPIGQTASDGANFTWNYCHYTISYDTGGMGTVAPEQSMWHSTSGKEVFGYPAYCKEAKSGNDMYAIDVNNPNPWYLDPNDESTAVEYLTEVTGDVTVYCKWLEATGIIESVTASITPEAGDVIPDGEYIPAENNLSDYFVSIANTDCEIGWIGWENPDGDTTFTSGKTYTVRFALNSVSPTVFFMGHSSVQYDENYMITNPGVCFNLNINGTEVPGSVEDVYPTFCMIQFEYTVETKHAITVVADPTDGGNPTASISGTSGTVFIENGGNILFPPVSEAKAGDVIKITPAPADGYEVAGISCRTESGENINITLNSVNYIYGGSIYNGTFTMPDEPVTVTVKYNKTDDKYPITYSKSGDAGTVNIIAPTSGAEGEEITVKLHSVGYFGTSIIESFEVKGEDGTVIPVTANGNNYTFTMPAQPVVVTVVIVYPSSRLLSIVADGGALTPAFDPEVTDYTIVVPYETTEIALSAEHTTNLIINESEWKPGSLQLSYNPNYSGVITKVDGKVALEVGKNTVHLTASFINGFFNETDYTVTIIRAAYGTSNITVVTDPTTGGSVTGAGEYRNGSEATLRATAESGYIFFGWYDGETLLSTDENYTFAVTENITIKALFMESSGLENTRQMSMHESLIAFRTYFRYETGKEKAPHIAEIGAIAKNNANTNAMLVDGDGNLVNPARMAKVTIFKEGVQLGNICYSDEIDTKFTVMIMNITNEQNRYDTVGYTIYQDEYGNKKVIYTATYIGIRYSSNPGIQDGTAEGGVAPFPSVPKP